MSEYQDNTLRIGDSAYSLGYFSIPYGQKEDLIAFIHSAYKKACSTWPPDQEGEPTDQEKGKPGYQLFAMTGWCDLMVAIEQKDIRFSQHFQNALTLFPAERSSWIHAVPYVSDAWKRGEPEYETGMLFQLFLKARRDPYRGQALKAATTIGNELNAMLGRFGDKFQLNIFTTLGWPDCLLWGSFHGSSADHIRLLQEVEQFTIEVKGEEYALFRKRLTLAGFKLRTGNEQRPGFPLVLEEPKVGTKRGTPEVTPIFFARTRGGKYREEAPFVYDYAQALSRGREPDIRGTDGKWDLVAFYPRAKAEAVSFRDLVLALYTLAYPEESLGGRENDFVNQIKALTRNEGIPVEALETHILTHSVEKRTGKQRREPVFRGLKELVEPSSRLDRRIKRTWELVEKAVITRPLRNEIAASLSLCRLINDGDNRSAVDYLAHGALDAIQEMLMHLRVTKDELMKSFPESGPVGDLHSTLQGHLRAWCSAVGQAIRQRASGSFENLFDRPLSVPAFRGSLQKMLHTADGLMREFFGYLPPALTEDPVEPHCHLTDLEPEKLRRRRPPRYASVFAPTVRICSRRYLDLVEIPSRYAFSIQLVLPQLWHEVGQGLFHRRFNIFVNPLQDTLYRSILKYDLRISPDHALRRVGDHFSDTLVFLYGFGQKFDAFSTYLCGTLKEAAQEHMSSNSQKRWIFEQLVDRLLVVRATGEWVRSGGEGTYRRLRELRKDRAVVRDIAAVASHKFFGVSRRDPRTVVEAINETWHRAVDSAIGSCIDLLAETYKTCLAFHDVATDAELQSMDEAIERGELVDPGDYLVNELFYRYYRKTIKRMSSEEPRPPFRELGSLGFTGLQAFRNTGPFKRGRLIRRDRLKEQEETN